MPKALRTVQQDADIPSPADYGAWAAGSEAEPRPKTILVLLSAITPSLYGRGVQLAARAASGPRPLLIRPATTLQRMLFTDPVSYTHLTLPTILRV